MGKVFKISVQEEDAKKRLDVFLSGALNDLSRSYIQKGIEEGWIRVNDRSVKPHYKLKKGDVIVANIPSPKPLSLEPENIPLDIIHEDRDIIVVNKPRGMVVYPAPGNYSGTLVNALLYHTKDLSGINGVMRPGIVHRLDKDTSGVIVVAKNDMAHRELVRQFKNKLVRKTYLAVVWGDIPEDRATIEAPIGRHPVKRVEMAVTAKNGKEAVTHFKVLERFGDFTFIEVNIETGRTHQIRVHMSFIGHPVVGDPLYSRKKSPFNINGQALHAYRLGLYHPRSGEFMTFEAPIPQDLTEMLNTLRKRVV
ncbi:RluA family pseudouridine synthase [Thermosediminibacter litoriperuensis]|uniref:Pseudouridine synthase n=1 Tax=Thermosediminibacter litoriperuensis TaxID=291989 RepID=A0A5S5B252_9FIRM|nr:RluA family pseudouridine synthase [Thermosediminibacter litoriperuensis]TYP60010.1 ribosomal large subunit pseudouridine synthase D [Thermosediminibacter litoriperuensis]